MPSDKMQYGGADHLDSTLGMSRPADQADMGNSNMQYGGADHIDFSGTKTRPPFSNPAGGSMDLGGADTVGDKGDNQSNWPWAGSVGECVKPL